MSSHGPEHPAGAHAVSTWTLTPRALLPGHPAAVLWPYLLPGVGGALVWLRSHGIERGQRIGLAGLNTPATAALLQALPLAGVTTVLFNRRLTGDDLMAQAGRAHVNRILAEPTHPLAKRRTTIAIPAVFPDQPVADATPLTDTNAALVLFTSGTSGTAKAARLSWAALRHAADAAVQTLGLTPASTWLGCLPLDHIGGAMVVLRSGRGGGTVMLHERFDADAVTQVIDGGAIHGLSVVPTMLHRLLAARGERPWPTTLRCLLTGGGPLAPDDIARSTALGLPPSQTYGLTEAASQVCTLLPTEAAAHPGSAGRPLPGMQVRIVDEVIQVRGPALFSGYEDAGVVGEPLPADGWFSTGDLGTIDDKEFLTVHGRRSDLIVSGGENVYPAEVEAVLERHPLIAEAGVYGISDAEWGQVVAAVLVARGPPPDDDQLGGWLATNLAGFKQPRRWRWAEALPRTASGKLQRHLLGA
ncbi:MAG: AMP-binding protein [Planctomycetes bacterium]|nr:AMP-binding protein [Planctomycetota bacterium]